MKKLLDLTGVVSLLAELAPDHSGAVAGAALISLMVTSASLHAHVGGNLAQYPPEELEIEVTTTPEGPVLSATEFELVTGDYYRVSITTDGEQDWRFESPDLLRPTDRRRPVSVRL